MTLLENWDISWKVGLDSHSHLPGRTAALMWLCCWIWDPSWQKCCIFQEKSLWVEPGGVLEPQRNDGFLSFPHQDLGSSTVLPGERKLMGFKHMKEKGLEKHSPLFFKERS